jgi:hypothetical protein
MSIWLEVVFYLRSIDSTTLSIRLICLAILAILAVLTSLSVLVLSVLVVTACCPRPVYDKLIATIGIRKTYMMEE